MKRPLLIALFSLLLLSVLAGCSENSSLSDSGGAPEAFRAEDWVGTKISAITGMMLDQIILDNIPGAEPVYFNNIVDGVEALKNGKIDAIIDDDAALRLYAAKNPGLRILEPFVTMDDYGVVTAKGDDELLAELNDFITLIKSDGTYDDMLFRWLDTAESPPMPDIPVGTGSTLRFGTSGYADGFSFFKNNELTGFDVEFARRFAVFADRRLDITVMDFGALIPAVQSGKVDFAASLFTITEERKQTINFTDPYYTGGTALAVLDTQAAKIFRAEDFAGKTFAIITGSIWDSVLEEFIPDANMMFFSSEAEAIMALKQGKVDATFTGTALIGKFNEVYPELQILYPSVEEGDCAFIFGKEDPALRERFNQFLQEIRDNGVYADMEQRWIYTFNSPDMPVIEATGQNGKLVFATSGISDVFSYIKNGQLVGFEVEMAHRFAQYMGMELEIQIMDFAALIPYVISGRANFAGNNFGITEERKQSVDFSDVIYTDGNMVVVLREGAANDAPSAGFWQDLKTGFERNLIHENRWKLIVDGLQVSLIITFFAFALATIGGFGVCGLRMSKNPLLRAIGALYINILRGTPIVVALMITFYIVFAKSSISGTWVAVIAFGANGAAFIGEIIRSAILTIDKGQVEAARSMGFSKTGAFFTVTFPQAVRVAFPTYMSEFVSMFKTTSVVGYIAIIDLTKAGDIIRSRTYDAFFPLIIVALVYLVVASVMIWFFNYINRVTNKRLRKVVTK